MYNRYAESGRVAWAQKYAYKIDPAHNDAWKNIATPGGEIGMILRKITTEFKFVRPLVNPSGSGSRRLIIAASR
jgi:hypothetical protein